MTGDEKLRELAIDAIVDQCYAGKELTRGHAAWLADAVLAAVLPEHRSQVIEEVDTIGADASTVEHLTDEALAAASEVHGIVHPNGPDGLYEPQRNPSGCDKFWCLQVVPELAPVGAPRLVWHGRKQAAEQIARALEQDPRLNRLFRRTAASVARHYGLTDAELLVEMPAPTQGLSEPAYFCAPEGGSDE